MHELCATLYDAGYDYMLDPDHAPSHPDDPDVSPKNVVSGPYAGGSGRMTQGFSFQFGFVIATIQVKNSRTAYLPIYLSTYLSTYLPAYLYRDIFCGSKLPVR